MGHWIKSIPLLGFLITLPLTAQVSEIQRFLTLAKEARTDLNNKPRQEEKRKKALIRTIHEGLPDFGNCRTLESAIKNFVTSVLPETSSFKIVNSMKTSFHGNSGDLVFYVRDEKHKTRYVVKAFVDSQSLRSYFLLELSSLAFLSEKKGLKKFAVAPLAVAKCKWKKATYGLLLESVAAGKRMDQCILEIAHSKDSSRAKRVKKVAAAFETIGASLARLHGVDNAQKAALSQKHMKKLQEEVALLQTHPKCKQAIDWNRVKAYADPLIQAILELPPTHCFNHGDTNLKNVFFNPLDEQVTFIDTARLHKSMDKEELPISESSGDIIQMRYGIEKHAHDYLTARERRTLVDALYQGYAHDDVTLRKAHDIYAGIIQLSINCNYEQLSDPTRRKRHKQLFEESVQFLQHLGQE